jgi:hypothetical protein
MNWSNLKQYRCPKCNHKLLYRLKGSSVQAVRSGSREVFMTHKDSYHCFGKCEFSITTKRLREVVASIKTPHSEEFDGLTGPMPGKKVSLLFS